MGFAFRFLQATAWVVYLAVFAAWPIIDHWEIVSSDAWWNKWQQLISGALAVITAAVGATLLWYQITQSDRHERARQRRMEIGARAMLPLALSEIAEYASEVAGGIKALYLASGDDEVILGAIQDSATLADAHATLRGVIEATDSTTVVQILSRIISEVQILEARLRDVRVERPRRRPLLRINLETYLLQVARIHALVEALFPYARGETEVVNYRISWDRISGALWLWDISSSDRRFEKMFARIDRWRENGASPLG